MDTNQAIEEIANALNKINDNLTKNNELLTEICNLMKEEERTVDRERPYSTLKDIRNALDSISRNLISRR